MTHIDDPDALRLEKVSRVYSTAGTQLRALDAVDLAIRSGSFTAVMGPSGSGKSTLLNCAAGLDRQTAGTVAVRGRSLAGMDDDDLTRFRREHLGFVFQGLNLLPYLTAYENVELPLRLAGGRIDRQRILAALAAVAMDDRAHRLPAELSGGQQQRVAVARAMVTGPAVLFADEPTGALDSVAAREVLGLLRDGVDRRGQTVVLVTHDPVAAAYADSVVFLADGRVEGTMDRPTPEAVAGRLSRLGRVAEVSR